MISKRRALLAAWDLWRVKRSGRDAIQAWQTMRLQAMVEFARTHSPYYQKLYQHLPDQIRGALSEETQAQVAERHTGIAAALAARGNGVPRDLELADLQRAASPNGPQSSVE